MKKKSFFEYIFLTIINKVMDFVSLFAAKVGSYSFLAALSKNRSKIVEFYCWIIFIFAFFHSFLFLFKKSLALSILLAVGSGCMVIAYGFPRVKEMMMDSLPVKWVIQLLDPNK